MDDRIARFDRLLSSPLNTDYWADEGIGIAARLSAEFDATDWRELVALTGNRDAAWLCRCAESLGDEACEAAVNVLQILRRKADQAVANAALESLHSLGRSGADLREQE